MYVMIIQHNHLNLSGVFVPARAKFFAPDPAARSDETGDSSPSWQKKGQWLSGARERCVSFATPAVPQSSSHMAKATAHRNILQNYRKVTYSTDIEGVAQL